MAGHCDTYDSCRRYPNGHDHSRPKPVSGALRQLGLGPAARVCQHVRRQQLDRYHHAEWNEHQVVEVAQNRDEVGDQVNGAERVGDDHGREGAGVPRCARVPVSEVKRAGVAPQPVRRGGPSIYQPADDATILGRALGCPAALQQEIGVGAAQPAIGNTARRRRRAALTQVGPLAAQLRRGENKPPLQPFLGSGDHRHRRERTIQAGVMR